MNETPTGAETSPHDHIERRAWSSNPNVARPWDINTVAVAVHPSGVKTLSPLIDACVLQGGSGVLVTGNIASDIASIQNFSKPPELRQELPGNLAEVFDKNKTNLFLISGSGGPEMKVEINLALEAIRHRQVHDNTLICCVEHDTGTLKETLTALHERGVSLGDDIDVIFTADRGSPNTYKADVFSQIPPHKFVTTGPCMWDALHTENTESDAISMRKHYGITSDDLVVVHYAERGHGLWSEMEIDTTPALLGAMKELARDIYHKKVVLLYRFHPGDDQPAILNRLIADSVGSGMPDNLRLLTTQPDEASKTDGTMVSSMADVSTSSYSTMLTGVALRGARGQDYDHTGQMAVYYLSPEVKKQISLSQYSLPTPVQEGSALAAGSVTELVATLKGAIFDKPLREVTFHHQTNELRDRYRFKGSATAKDRTLLQIRKLLKNL